MTRGYCGIGVINMKTGINYGTLLRSAFAFGVDFTFLVGRRFQKMPSDCVCSYRHIPLYEYKDAEDFLGHIPYSCVPVAIEITESARLLHQIEHPERAVYILGQEDGSIPNEIIARCPLVLKIPTRVCLNVATAGSIVLYDRFRRIMEG